MLLDQGGEDHRLDTLHAQNSEPFENAGSFRFGHAVRCDLCFAQRIPSRGVWTCRAEKEWKTAIDCAVVRHIVPVSGLTLAPWRLRQVAGRSSGQDPHATLNVF